MSILISAFMLMFSALVSLLCGHYVEFSVFLSSSLILVGIFDLVKTVGKNKS